MMNDIPFHGHRVHRNRSIAPGIFCFERLIAQLMQALGGSMDILPQKHSSGASMASSRGYLLVLE